MQALDAPFSVEWLSSAVARVADPSLARTATPLELARACLALQDLDDRQQNLKEGLDEQQQDLQGVDGQQQQGLQGGADGEGLYSAWNSQLKSGLLQEMVKKLQGGRAKKMAQGDVVDVILVCVCV